MPTNKKSSRPGNVLLSGLRSRLLAPHPRDPGAPPSAPHPRPLLLSTGTALLACAAGDGGCGCPFKQQNSCCNRRPGTGPFRRVEPIFAAATNGSAAFSAGDPNFAARSLALKKKKKKKKWRRKTRVLHSEARGSRSNRSPPRPSASPLRGARGRARDPSPEAAGPRAPRPSGAWGRAGSRPPLGRGSPWRRGRRYRSRGAVSEPGSPSAAPLGRRPGGEGPALPRRRPLAASPGLRSMPRAG